MNWKIPFVIGFLIFSAFLYGFTHEFTHKYLAELHGCDAEINYNPVSGKNRNMGGFMSTTYNCSNTGSYMKKSNFQSQMMVEAVGYQLAPIYGIAVGIFIWIFLGSDF